MIPRKYDGSEPLPVRIDGIPSELGQSPQWVTWRLETRNGKATKVPYANDGRRASSTDPTTWTTFEDAIRSYRDNAYDGIGFVLTENDPYVGVDLDKCRVPGTGTIEPPAQAIIERLNSYTETSPSRTGIHILIHAKKPGKKCRKPGIEVYDRGRYFCVTGHHIDGTPTTIEDGSEALAEIYHEVFTRKDVVASQQAGDTPRLTIDDETLVKKARASKNGDRFAALWNGDTNGYPSHSEADLALCSELAFWTACDADRIDRLFRQSGLYRDKWERDDYRRRTIDTAIEGCTDVYEKRKRSPRSDVSFRLTDVGNAQRFARDHGDTLRFSVHLNAWIDYTGKVWRRDMLRVVKRCGQQTVQAIFREVLTPDEEKREKSFRWAMRSESAPRLKAMIGEAEPLLAIDIAEFDRDPSLVNFKNGTLEQNGTLREHRRDDYIMQIANVAYDANAKCPHWLGFLDCIMGGQEDLVAFLQRAVGYSMTGHIDERCLFVLWGLGRNGKTTFVETIARMMGDYAGSMRAQALMTKRWDTIPNDIAHLRGKRFVTVTEAGEHARLDESLVKQVTGGDTLRARFLYGELFEFRPQCKLWLSTNHKPMIRGTDSAIWDRIRLVPFNVRIADPKPRREIDAMFRRELSGIASWAVRGMQQWYRDGLAEPDQVLEATAAYRSELDLVGAFLAECCELRAEVKALSKDLYRGFQFWAEKGGEASISHQMFGRKLSERSELRVDRRDKRSRTWAGIKLLDEAIPPADWKPKQ